MHTIPGANDQFEHDYIFDSSRTQAEFNLTPTPCRDGIPATLHAAVR